MTKQQKEERRNQTAAHINYFSGDGRAALQRSPKPIKTTRKKTRRVARTRAH
jgi:hypothetical protein